MAFASPANLALEGGDPREPKFNVAGEDDLIRQQSGYAGTKVPFRLYLSLAEEQRAREAAGGETAIEEKASSVDSRSQGPALTAHEQELLTARRALRTASWAAIFYLITTDILGPFNAPFALSQVGYVPGVVLYFVMGAIACYTGLILWHLFCKLDSDRYPIKTFSDLGERIFGTWARHICTVLQSLQLIINVGTIQLANGQSLSQIVLGANRQLCFSVCIVIWAIVGMIIGQIRTLKNFGWLANSAVWLNLSIIFISMGFVSHSPPNYAAAIQAGLATAPGPVMTAAFVDQTLYNKVNGIMNMVFAYGGAMIFPEFMAEMRRPMDFWKGMCAAQLLIFTAYMLYGVFVYSYQGQFTLAIAYQGVSYYPWQTVNNVIGLVSGIIAGGLYGNIGIKVAYIHIVEEWFKGPPLLSRKGHGIWIFMVFIYWALAFVVGSAIPQVQTISGLVAAICIMQFTYTFPPGLLLGYHIIIDAYKNDPGDSWYTWSRWRRGVFSGHYMWKLFNFILFLGSAAMACLGMYGSGTAIQEVFANGAATSFGCTSPVAVS